MRPFAAFALSALLAAGPLQAAANDPYLALTEKLAGMASRKLNEKKIAVLSFEYVDGRSSPGGRAVAEKLTNKFVELGEFTVIERTMVEKVMGELEFQNRGTVDPEAAKKLGKGLGVEAIVTGTLSDGSFGTVEVNARIIKTESYEIIAAGTERVKKTWDDQAPAPSASADFSSSERPMREQAPRSSGGRARGYVDLMMGFSNGTMDVEFSGTQLMSASELGLSSSFPPSFTNATMTGFTLDTSVPIGIRVGGFGKVFGGSFEMGHFSHGNTAQRLTTSINGFSNTYNFRADYIRVGVLHFSGDLLLRFPTGERIIPYFGLGMGLSINNVTSDYVRMNGSLNATLNETVPGFLFRVPAGVRFHVNDRVALFGELRFWMNTFTFTRNLSGESDSITMRGVQFLTGVGFLF